MQAVQKVLLEVHHLGLTVQIQYSVQSHLPVAVEVVEETLVVQVLTAAQVAAVQTEVVQVQVMFHQFLHHKAQTALQVVQLQAEAVAALCQPVQQGVLQEVQAVQVEV